MTESVPERDDVTVADQQLGWPSRLLIWLGSGALNSATPSSSSTPQLDQGSTQHSATLASLLNSIVYGAQSEEAHRNGDPSKVELDMNAAYLSRIKRFTRILTQATQSTASHFPLPGIYQNTSVLWLRSLAGLTEPSENDQDAFHVDLGEAFNPSAEPQFLGYFAKETLYQSLEKYGIIEELGRLGYKEPSLILDCDDPVVQRISLTDQSLFTKQQFENKTPAHSQFLADLYLRRRKNFLLDNIISYQLLYRLTKSQGWSELQAETGEKRSHYISLPLARDTLEFFETQWPKSAALSKRGHNEVEVTEIAWMQMQNPRIKPSEDRPLFPGQRFGSLGISRNIALMILGLATESQACDALTNCPFSWINGYYYVKYSGHRALSPAFSAYIDWTTEQLQPYIDKHGLAFVAWAFTNGHVKRFALDVPEIWNPEELVVPSGSQVFIDWLTSDAYRKLQLRAKSEMSKGPPLYIDIENAPELWSKSSDESLRQRAESIG